jgi:putative restriction endonuclease
MGTDPNSPDNRWFLDAMQRQFPVIYFLGRSPGRYQPIIPTFIVGWHPEHLRVQLAFGALVGASAQATLPASPERRYALREIKARLHQASFRDAVLSAYRGRCAISHLPERRLLDAAHIVMDTDEQLGQPIVSNGLQPGRTDLQPSRNPFENPWFPVDADIGAVNLGIRSQDLR